MDRFMGLLRTCRHDLEACAGGPARWLASFMDDVDEVWLDDTFMDQPGSLDRAG